MTETVALIDYGSGNLRSAEKALVEAARRAGSTASIVTTADPDVVAKADRILLPGVGAFNACMDALQARPGLVEAMGEAVKDRGVPFLGVCVGMQLLATRGLEFGERAGLETADIALCQAIVTIPVDERHRSLNLAQAVALNAYEWRLTVTDTAPARFDNQEPPAPREVQIGMFEQLEKELDNAGFFHPPEKRPSMQRNLRVALSKANMTDQEVRTFRGVITALSKGRGRVLAKLAAKAAKAEDGGQGEVAAGERLADAHVDPPAKGQLVAQVAAPDVQVDLGQGAHLGLPAAVGLGQPPRHEHRRGAGGRAPRPGLPTGAARLGRQRDGSPVSCRGRASSGADRGADRL